MSYVGLTNARIYKPLAKLVCCLACPPLSPPNLLAFLCETICGDFFWKRSCPQNTVFYFPSFFTGNVWFSRSVQREFNSWVQFTKKPPKNPSSVGFHLFIWLPIKFIICFSGWWLWRWVHWWAFNLQKLLQGLKSVPVSTPTQLNPRVLNLACCLMSS